ncbi:probable multidrug resistance-associated protein lethal(2)03659 [Atheta coriaria]|uniref:probable multidrug resistance-associated protein lethal(2)03659 n=1 Tax=Dalotia coriaria TaxID=877792 RepID=UPI0031F44BDA
MDTSKKFDNKSPELSSNFLSKLVFGWVLPFFRIGLKKNIELKDLYNSTKPDLSEQLGNALEINWEKELLRANRDKRKPSLWKALSATFFRQFAVWGLILFLQSIVFKLSHPIILAHLIKYFDPAKPYSEHEGWLLAFGVILVSLLNIICIHHANIGCLRIGMRCRIACCSLMYRKLLKLSKASLNQTATGQMINLMSNDVQRFEFFCSFLHYIWIMPIQAVVASYLMWDSVGWPAVVGVLTIAVQAIPLQGYLSKLQGSYRSEIAGRTDYRVKIMSEITSGIQIIKMYAWEKPFEKVVELARKLEIDIITKKSYILGYTTALMVFTERTSLYVTVLFYVLSTGNPLSGELVFSMAQFFNTIQLYMAILFPLGVVFASECQVSVRRIKEFLTLGENLRIIDVDEDIKGDKGAIKVVKGRASWSPSPIIETLTNINFEIESGSLCAIVGSVGSGKSSLLQLLLRELPLNSGKLEVQGEVSYASQEPWLFVSTVRNNILFGQPFVKSRYKQVVRVCALETDFAQFPHGDKTLVGERGVSLSGGQRARINLARAVYRAADIYLFDDPLSAVDTHVGKQLFDECISRHLEGKTRILVTHQLQFLKTVDKIIIVNNGQIEKIGTYAELAEKELSHLKHTVPEEEAPGEDIKRTKRLMSVTSHESSNVDEEEDEPEETQELMEKGSIPTSTYVDYFKSGANVCVLALLVFLILIAQMFCNSSDLWLKHWTNQEENVCADQLNEFNSTTEDGNSTDFVCFISDNPRYMNINIYTGLIVATVILTTVRSLFFYKVCMNASKSLHNQMFSNILQATMRFFDTNPSGRILNRFSKDIGAIDELLPRLMLDSIQIFMVMSGILVMVWIVSPIMIAPTLVLGGIFAWIRYIYMSSAQDIKRLEGVTKAPVFSHVSASLSGLTTIRSSGAQYLVAKEFDVLQDQHTSSFVLMIFASEAFGFYLDLLSVFFVAVVTLQFFAYDTVMEGDVGLVISQSLILTGMLQYGMRQTTEVANNMTSVERVLQYTKLDKEGPFESTPAQKPHRDWPMKGEVKLKNLYLQYSTSDPPVLKNLNLEIPAGFKVGIVGRTGAGKSSMIAAVFRLAPIEGTVVIDDVDTKNIGLNDLRSNISIIPQEPVLFSTTVRHNLDPFDRCNDETLWKALEDVELKDAVQKLEQEVSESGSNFSAGQRQLICLARAIIRKNKVIIMDEATANVDHQTDALIQKTIRHNFQDCTVLTIAHRLNTIMDSDRVVVMDHGEIVEYAHPYELLQNKDGVFYAMLQQTGESMFANLLEIARESYEQKAETNETQRVNNATSMHSVALDETTDNSDGGEDENDDNDSKNAT